MLRFWAFFAVFLFHAIKSSPGDEQFSTFAKLVWMLSLIVQHSGRFGVEVFFTLSAFLITSILRAEHEARGKIELVKFYVRRVLRIWPLYFAVALSVFALALAQRETELQPYFWPFVFMVPNWAWAILGTPNTQHRVYRSLMVFWSLGVEEQFYLLWPLILRLADAKNTRRAAWLLIATSVLTCAICWSMKLPHPAIYANSLVHLDSIAVGILIAVEWGALRGDAASRGKRLRFLGSRAALDTGIVGILIAGWVCTVYGINDTLFVLLGYPLVAWSSYLILFYTLLNQRTRNLRGPIFDGLVYLGRISYGLYLFHGFVLEGIRLWVQRAVDIAVDEQDLPLGLTLLTASAGLAGTVLLAGLSYKYFETPFLRMKTHFSVLPTRPAVL